MDYTDIGFGSLLILIVVFVGLYWLFLLAFSDGDPDRLYQNMSDINRSFTNIKDADANARQRRKEADLELLEDLNFARYHEYEPSKKKKAVKKKAVKKKAVKKKSVKKKAIKKKVSKKKK